jgi:N-sulfoglucosamine sulfohydrolase
MKRPNIILMVADDHGIETLGCYGNSVVKTPAMDQLADDGVKFTNAFCTSSSCAASRSVILTGKHNHTNGTYGHVHGAHHFSCFSDVTTLPAYLNEAGYRTGCIGKKHYAPESIFPFEYDLANPDNLRNDIAMSEDCREFIEDDKPFFLYWCSHNPHRGAVVEDHPLKPNSFGNMPEAYPGDTEEIYSEDEVEVPFFLNDSPEVRAELAQYYQSISRLDRGIARLMQILKDTGKYENTVVMYISDNGAAFPEAKTTLYEPGMNLPCIVKSPFHEKRGGVCNGLITWADLTPTILDFAGTNVNESDFHGRSFKSIIDQEEPEEWYEEVYASHTFHEITNYYPMRVVRTRKYKFIWNIAHPLTYSSASDLWASCSWQGLLRDGSNKFGTRTVEAYLHRPRFELYDLENDPDEINNLADRTEFQDMVEDFSAKLQKFQKETKDPWVSKWIYE